MLARGPSRAISHARGHLRVSRFARRTTEKRETARSLDSLSMLQAPRKLFKKKFKSIHSLQFLSLYNYSG